MADSQTPKTTKITKKVTKPRKPKAEASEASSSKASASNKSKQVSMEEVEVSSKPQKEKTIEEVYQKKTQIEHILLRPDTYVGSVEPLKEKMWVYDSEMQKLVYR